MVVLFAAVEGAGSAGYSMETGSAESRIQGPVAHK